MQNTLKRRTPAELEEEKLDPPAIGALSGINIPRVPGTRELNRPLGKDKRRSYQSYTDLDRVSALILCAAVGVRDACHTLNVPERTMRRWLAEAGGLEGLTAEIGKALGVTRYAVALKVCQAIVQRLPEFNPGELLDALRALSAGAINPASLPGTDAPPPAQVLVMVGDSRTPLVVDVGNPSAPTAGDSASPEPKQLPATTD